MAMRAPCADDQRPDTEITTNFPEAGTPELTISGYDSAFPLTMGKSSRSWKNARDSDAAREIAGFTTLSPTYKPRTSSTTDRTESGKRS